MSSDKYETDSGKRRVFARTVGKGAASEGSYRFRDVPNVVQQGSTAHFNVFYDSFLGPQQGSILAQSFLLRCERDYNTIAGYFAGVTPANLPFNVVITNLKGEGAYHYDCGATELYC